MRHSSIVLTMDTYGHLFPGQEAETVARFSDLLGNDPPNALRATGTTDARADQSAKQSQKRSGRRSDFVAALCVADTTRRDEDSATADPDSPHNSHPIADLGGIVRPGASGNESGTAGIRTQNQRIMSPLL